MDEEEVRTEDILQLQSETVATAGEMTTTILDTLKRTRIQNGYSQRDLAERSGITQTAISNYENGAFSPSLENLNILLAAMGKTLAIVPLPGTDESLVQRYLSMIFLDSEERKSTINVYDPKLNVTRNEVENVMQDIIDGKVFLSRGGNELKTIVDVRMTTVESL